MIKRLERPGAWRVLGIVIFASLLFTSPVTAATQSTKNDRPYDGKLLRLSEILGSVHYLRALCGANEEQLWRDQMQELLKTEGTSALRRIKLVKSFNKGYRGFRRTYRSCTESANLAIEKFMVEGAAIAETLVKQNK